MALSESGVHYWVLFALGKFTFVLEIEKMAQRSLCVLSRLDNLLDFLLLIVSFSLSRCGFLCRLLLLRFVVDAADRADGAISAD